ncbi:MAG: mercury methylation corrinoid protein HgcA [Elusimicrobiota bacterium]
MTEEKQSAIECNCGSEARLDIRYRSIPVEGKIEINGREIDKVSTKWSMKDYLGQIMSRLDVNPAEAGGRIINALRGIQMSSTRMNYAVKPGIYAVGNPGKDSPVLVSANYKLSFDVLRRELAGQNVWILVIDSRGVNVWCAAGKGTFGTKELAFRIYEEKLSEVVSHKNVIVPQLGAPGVCAHMVKMYSEFNVIYGPVRAEDIPEFLRNGMKADEKMRRVRFDAGDRLTVAWLEFAIAAKTGFIVTIALLLTSFFMPQYGRTAGILILSIWTAIFSGTLIVPLMLPYLRGRAFSVKGALLGMGTALIPIIIYRLNLLQSVSVTLGISAVTAYIAANFTGASTYTSLSGVKKELKYAIPAILSSLAVSLVLGIVSVFNR